ncbi:outer membrane protein OmpA-like peptidoglycan-associated protein [Hymenobacter luteus]|uniref:Outer membrane protein OmpA-like peptidoglycan-associated protein n=2 Tax=Hymenobacter TaxID=89966 RepID=A0A7W9T4T0_9BACT|nr:MULTISPECIES: OmpA family protein [Hymenobacter]MBB4603126.1 outer membrane protein OmpA-like peptidoglycan-associated protein [Hymenobacter latericoloratus]MBB6060915.1 outer membrane protein OmpA-like peptidoglycan-associated protein [Hymenobacter luteus]
MHQDQTLEALVQSALAGPVLGALGAAVQAEGPALQQAAAQLLKLVIPAFAGRSQQPGGAEALWNWLEGVPTPTWQVVLSADGAAGWRGRGVTLLEALLGPSYASRTAFISQRSGLPQEAMPRLVDVVVVATLGVLREQASARQLNAASLSQWLQSQPGAVPQLPPSPRAASAPDAAALPPGASRPSLRSAWRVMRRQAAAPQNWVLLLLPAVALGFGIGRLNSSPAVASGPAAAAVAPAPGLQPALLPTPRAGEALPAAPAKYVDLPAAAAPPPPATPGAYAVGPHHFLDYPAAPGQPVLLLLGDGTSQRVTTHSTEYQLYRLLAGTSQAAQALGPDSRWIPVDRAYFQAGQATLPAAARQQLQSLASILRAFPRARFQVKGYSDSLDGYHAPPRLSESRAWAAVQTLREFGIANNRLQVRASEVRPELSSATDEAGNSYQPYLSLQFVGNLPAGVLAPTGSTGAGKAAAAGAAAQAARLRKARRTTATTRLRHFRPRKQRPTKARLWFRRLGHRLRGHRAGR